MSDAAERLKPTLEALSVEEREELIQFLIDLNDGPADPHADLGDFDPEYRAELDRRIDDMRSGRDPGVPREEFMDRMREKYG